MKNPEILPKEFEAAKAELIENRENRNYYDEQADTEIKNTYYQSISFTDSNLKDSIHNLLEETHTNELNYTPHRYLYPWVDLQENGELKSLYSGKGMEPLAAIEHDIRLHEFQAKGLVNAFSGDNLLNCEHVVPQSWFDKKEPMRGDLHHLFACEPECNSSRSNYPYTDFSDYAPEARASVIKDGCGKADGGKFEPEYGKGIVARATLYFLIRYKEIINKDSVDVPLLLEWHRSFPISTYEKHRNLAIYEMQGNRNPFIDVPDKAEEIMGL
ncbi:endonuclease I [Peribacillus cavernae]|uniref:Endonuclease I n=1 Tax=Peribacillus cavernae TaxID=1674310 RepID=A0A3S0VHQ0_9BACI|nr:endonuclease [Peribacillus cavernae]MDQ0217750.1 endonuclease I [Peribacillus cavernae]RUQ28210.1 endonuclease I [Peribacillus cavernae]